MSLSHLKMRALHRRVGLVGLGLCVGGDVPCCCAPTVLTLHGHGMLWSFMDTMDGKPVQWGRTEMGQVWDGWTNDFSMKCLPSNSHFAFDGN